MNAQIKKAARETSKNTIYSADGEVPTTYNGWKARLLRIDYNWRLKLAEGMTGTIGHTAQKAIMPQKGGQALTTTPTTKTVTGTTYGGRGVPMDIDALAMVKCF